MPQLSNIRRSLDNNKFDETTSRIIYYLYETKLTRTSDGTFNEGYNYYICEQFMPKSCAAADVNWPPYYDRDEEENRKQMITALGNFFLLDVDNEKELKNCHNEAYSMKLPKLKDWSRNIRSNQILNTINKWDEKEIISRNHLLLQALSENIWAIEKND